MIDQRSAALDPELWKPARATQAPYDRQPTAGQLIGWRFSVWRLVEVRDINQANWTDHDWSYMNKIRPEFVTESAPYMAIMRHECGPLLDANVQEDGLRHVRCPAGFGRQRGWLIVPERYPVCSCCAEPYPCREVERDELAAVEAYRFDRALAATMPDTCAHCVKPIGHRQKRVTFAGDNLIVPGGPPVAYHLSGSCHGAAIRYEKQRLESDPDVTRLVTCFGDAFLHADGLGDCSVGVACTGHHHGPLRNYMPCHWEHHDEHGITVRPSRRCVSDLCRGGRKAEHD